MTASVKVTVNTMTSPSLYDPSFVVDVTAEIMGKDVSIIIALSALIELAAPGSARVNVAVFPAASTMVPLFNAKADVLVYFKSLLVSPVATV